MKLFTVKNNDGTEVQLAEIVKEDWARHLYDPREFLISSEGALFLLDEAGQVAHPPPDRFLVVWFEKRNAA